MKIKEVLNILRNDFSAIMECEYCGHTQKNMYGYNDDYYHKNVIPAMQCGNCGKDRNGGDGPAGVDGTFSV